MMATIGYARVSTVDQNLDLQLDALRAVGAAPICTDYASGASLDRTGLTDALAAAKAGDTLAVWRLDRLSRSVRDLFDVLEQLERQGVRLLVTDQAIDTGGAGGRLMLHLFCVLAEFERASIRERVLAGQNAARQRGRQMGRPAALAPDQVFAMRDLVRAGKSIKEIGQLWNVSRTTTRAAVLGLPPYHQLGS